MWEQLARWAGWLQEGRISHCLHDDKIIGSVTFTGP